MLAFMPKNERAKLADGLSHIGVTNIFEWEHLLDKWKNEALNPEYEIQRTYKQTVKPRTIEIVHTR